MNNSREHLAEGYFLSSSHSAEKNVVTYAGPRKTIYDIVTNKVGPILYIIANYSSRWLKVSRTVATR